MPNPDLSAAALASLTTPTQPAFLAEYRSGSASASQFAGKDGRFRTLVRATHQLEIGTAAIALEQILPDSTDPKTWTPPAPKGAQVIVSVSLTRASTPGTWRIRVDSVLPAAASR